MQNAKDTFLFVMRDRLAALNPERTCVMRGASRPAIVTEENELPQEVAAAPETFVLRWSQPGSDWSEALPLESAACEIRYWTGGSDLAAGMDRGRVLSALDSELRAVLAPPFTGKRSFGSQPQTALQTRVFWSDVAFGPVVLNGSALSRAATVSVFSFREAGER